MSEVKLLEESGSPSGSPDYRSIPPRMRGGRDSGRTGSFMYSSTRVITDSIQSLSISIRDGVHERLSFSGASCSVRELGGQSTIPKSSFNLIKNLVGAGVLALPSGLAAFADSPSGILPATIWIIIMGAAFGYYFHLIGKVCTMTKSATYREAWEDTMGRKGSMAVATVNMIKPALGCLAYSMILADTFQSLSITSGFANVSRNMALAFITLVAILPLCLMKNLDALAPFSVLGTLVIFLTVTAMGIRYFDGSYDINRNGRFLQDIPIDMQPVFGDYNGAWTSSVLIFCTMVYEAFVAHYNAPRFITELQRPTIQRFGWLVFISFGTSAFIYIAMTVIGFLTFGGNCNGYILNNYSTNDSLATACRIGIAFSVLFTYPIAFIGFRDGVLDMLELPEEQHTSNNLNVVTIFLLSVVTLLASQLRDLGMINSVGGGTLATAVCFVFPAFMFREAVMTQTLQEPTPAQRQEVVFAMALMVVGVIMGCIGVWIELQPDI